MNNFLNQYIESNKDKRFKQPTLYLLYSWQVYGLVALIAFLSGLIAVLIIK